MRKALGVIGLTLALLISMLVPAGPAGALAVYYYADGQQGLTGGQFTKGLSANIYVANPYIQCNGGEHTLMQLGLADANSNAVELGWWIDCNGATANPPRLFITYTNGGTWCGTYTPGPGTSCPLYVDNAANATNVGADLSTVAALCNGASLACVKKFSMQYTSGPCGADSNAWFFYYDNVNVGCVPASAFGTAFGTATLVHAFGEVYYTGATVPCTDMGNGKDPTGALGNTGPSYIGSVGYINPNPSTLTPNLNLISTASAAFAAVSVGSTGNRTFAVAGKGYTSTGGTPGNTGSC